MMRQLRKPKLGTVIGAGLCIVVVLIGWFFMKEEVRHPGYLQDLIWNPGFAIREYDARVSFNGNWWNNPTTMPDVQLFPGRLTIRIRMVDNLLDHHNFKGWTRKRVEESLGPRTVTEYFGDWDLVYYLGAGRYGNAIGDSEWLVFRLDSSGRVNEYKLVHD